MKVTKLGAIVASAVFVFAACGGGTTGGGGTGTVDIWSSLPRQGSSKGQSDTVVNGIKLALEKRGGKVGGWTINYVDQDDSTAEAGKWTPEKETDNATKAVADANLVAYVGTFNSGAAKISIPILCKAGIPMVSPANTYPGLTKPGKGEAGEPEKYYPDGCAHNYFRVVPADDLQGKVGADWAKELGATKVYILDDTEIYGKGVADVFDASAKAIGLTVLGHDQAPGKSTDYKALAAKIKDAGPDLVYYGGITQNNAGQLWKDLREAMPTIKLMGPDGIYEDAFIKAAGSAAEGTFLTFGGTTADQYTGDAAKFRDEYKTKFGADPEVYSIYGYEAANITLDAMDRAIKAGAKDAKSIRAGILAELAKTKDFKGVLGTWSFDANGDTTNTLFSGSTVTGGKFTFAKVLGQ